MGRRNLPANPLPEAVDSVSAVDQMPGLGKLWPAWAVLVACVWIAFWPALSNAFCDLDDPAWIRENFSFRGLGWEQIRFAFTTSIGGVYQPLGWLFQSLTYVLFGLDPRGFHFVSLLFHVVNVVLLHLLCVSLMARSMPEFAERRGAAMAWLCAVPVVLYAVHPLRVEAVAWASAQAYLPSITFSILATLAYLRAHPSNGGFHRSWMIGSSVQIVLAVLTKGSAVVLPFVFLILDAYPLGRLGHGRPSWSAVRKVLIEKAPILVLCLVLIAVAFVAKLYWIDPEETTQPLLVARVAQASFAAWFYLEKTVWPFGISLYYPRPEGDDFLSPLFVASCAGVVVAVSAAFWLRRRCPWLLATLAAYLVIASPYLGLARVSVALASDRYSHGPTMAWVVLGCAGLCRLAHRQWSRPAVLGVGAGAAMVACGLMALCSAQCRVWSSMERLWAESLENAPWSSTLHDFMGATYADQGRFDRAIPEYREALRIRPHYFDALCDLGAAIDSIGDPGAAIGYLREAAKQRPTDAKARLNLGAALVHEGHIDEAITVYRQALHVHPDFPNLHFNLGVALIQQRKLDEAITELTRAAELRPWYIDAHVALGGAFVLQGRQNEAVLHYRRALELDPNHSASRINLGLALARQGRSNEAITQLREAVQRDRQNVEAHHVLAAVLVSLGRIGEATTEFEEVLRLRPDHAQARLFLARARTNRM
jgi:protein O-mannosyl-transferase